MKHTLFKISTVTLIPVLLAGTFYIQSAMAAWSFEDDFEAYTTGALNGQGSWIDFNGSDLDAQVTTAQAYEGSQSILYAAASSNRSVQQNITAESTDNSVVYLSLRSSGTSDTGNWFIRFRDSSNATVMSVYLNGGTDGNIQTRSSSGTYYDVVSGYTADTWYTIGIEFDFTNNQWRDNVDNGTFSSWRAFGASRSNVSNVWIQANSPTTIDYYIDNISATYVSEGGGGGGGDATTTPAVIIQGDVILRGDIVIRAGS